MEEEEDDTKSNLITHRQQRTKNRRQKCSLSFSL